MKKKRHRMSTAQRSGGTMRERPLCSVVTGRWCSIARTDDRRKGLSGAYSCELRLVSARDGFSNLDCLM